MPTNDEYTYVVINGEVWHVPENQYKYLKVVNNRLVNTGSSSITMYKNWYEVDSTDNYPNIICPSGGACYVRTASGYGSTHSTVIVNSIEWSIPIENRDYNLISVFFVIIIGLSVFVNMFKRRSI